MIGLIQNIGAIYQFDFSTPNLEATFGYLKKAAGQIKGLILGIIPLLNSASNFRSFFMFFSQLGWIIERNLRNSGNN